MVSVGGNEGGVLRATAVLLRGFPAADSALSQPLSRGHLHIAVHCIAAGTLGSRTPKPSVC